MAEMMPHQIGMVPPERHTEMDPRPMHEDAGMVDGDVKLSGHFGEAQLLDAVQPERLGLLIGDPGQLVAQDVEQFVPFDLTARFGFNGEIGGAGNAPPLACVLPPAQLVQGSPDSEPVQERRPVLNPAMLRPADGIHEHLLVAIGCLVVILKDPPGDPPDERSVRVRKFRPVVH